MKKWKILSSSKPFDTKWFKVRQDVVKLPNGVEFDDYYLWESGDVAMTVPVTKGGKFLFVKQYKHGAGELMIEFPAGYIDENEDSITAARRELIEETGYKIDKIDKLGKVIHHPTKETGVLHLFLANLDGKSEGQKLEKSEDIEVIELTADDVTKMISTGEIWATATIAAFYMALNKMRKLKIS